MREYSKFSGPDCTLEQYTYITVYIVVYKVQLEHFLIRETTIRFPIERGSVDYVIGLFIPQTGFISGKDTLTMTRLFLYKNVNKCATHRTKPL